MSCVSARNELLLTNIEAITKVYGPGTRCTKRNAGHYEFIDFRGEYNVDALMEREEHRPRRRIWENALSTKAVANYEGVMREVVGDWLGVLDEKSEKREPVEASVYSMLIPFDSMGKVGFSKAFHGVKLGKENDMLHYLEAIFFGHRKAWGDGLDLRHCKVTRSGWGLA